MNTTHSRRARRTGVVALTAALALALTAPSAVAAGDSETTGASTEATFADVPEDHVFSTDVAWMARNDVTRGCNPPANDRYCPDELVTRGQMAAFLQRGFGK